ncbi:RNA polymerase sigma factor [Novipirellula sp. SH528]|uniref:RNA polymerase sigma factor n=1 Tax=Novipirellula sp. SH528 TaxID=3454466 RepID=UPI003FA03797
MSNIPNFSLTSPSLLAGLASRDDEIWVRFVQIYGPLIDEWIGRAKVNPSAVDDIAQDILLAIATSFDNYHHDAKQSGSLRRWIWGIAKNKIADWQRKDAQQVKAGRGLSCFRLINQLPNVPFEDSDPGSQHKTRMQLAARALAILQTDFEPLTWQAFWRSVIDGEKTSEIAQSLNMTAVAIRQSRFRVLRRLREELGEDLPGTL